MKPPVDILGLFTRMAGEDGTYYFSGTLDKASLKRLKQPENEILLVPVQHVPKALAGMLPKTTGLQDGLLMFAGTGATEPTTRRKG